MTLKFYAASKLGTIGAAAATVMACAALASPGVACAERSPGATATSGTPVLLGDTGMFKLTALTRSALVSNPKRGQLRVCNETGRTSALDEASAAPPFMPSGASRLEVNYNGKTAQIVPGECYRIRSQHVRITTDEPLGTGSSLEGTVAKVVPARVGLAEVSIRSVGGNAELLGVELNQIRSELKEDDRTARQATAELQEASRELNQAARELRAQPVA